MQNDESERGKRAHIDRDGTVHGSGSGAGGGNPGEDYDDDPIGGGGALPTDEKKEAEADGHARDKAPGGST